MSNSKNFGWKLSKYIFNKNFNFNRQNINKTLNKKISNLPVLKNDTNNVIEFNDGFNTKNKDDKPRSFWNLLKAE